jgi:hypothetical protein
MKIPKELVVRGFKWKVFVVHNVDCKYLDEPDMGCCVPKKREIYLSADIDLESREEVFFHEWGHAVIFESGLLHMDDPMEDAIVDNFAKELKLYWTVTPKVNGKGGKKDV